MLKTFPKMIDILFKNNQNWSCTIQEQNPDFFSNLQVQQKPNYLWIGCSDSRVPANQVVGLMPGEVFVHRNIANLVIHTDLNCLSVIQYAVEVLKIKHIMIVGHYGCGGIQAALENTKLGLVDNWLRHVQDVRQKHASIFEQHAQTAEQQWDLLSKLNVIEQTINLCQTTIVEEAWAKGQPLDIHGWIYHLKDGLLSDLAVSMKKPADLDIRYKAAIRALSEPVAD
jgi:carbonic anhydrase